MHPLSILMLGIAMSTDAFAAAVGKGAAMHRPRLGDALRAGLIFGTIEAVTPVIGWALGSAASAHVTAWDHWIAFGLLTLLGLHMIRAGLRSDASDERAGTQRRHGFWALAATGLATSIDALAVGVGLAFLDVNILAVAATIGLTTLVMVTSGILLGRVLGAMAGRRAEIGGGVLLLAIGSFILFEHLRGMA